MPKANPHTGSTNARDRFALLVRLEQLGALVPQTVAVAEEARWLALIRNAGSGAPSSNFHYLGGDVTDQWRTSGDDIGWVGADWFAGTTVNAADTYVGTALPFRNGALLETTDGTFAQQLYASGSTGVFLDAVVSGSLAAGSHWWPIAAFNDGGTNRILCWHVDGTATTHYGTLLDSHIVSLNAFGQYASHVATGLGTSDVFWVDGVIRDTSFTYIYGQQFLPDYDADALGNDADANYGRATEDLSLHLRSHHTRKRVARIANGSFTTVASWTFWDGTTWSSGVTNATPMVEYDGRPIRGDAGVKKISTDHWVLASHQMTDTGINVYHSNVPQGPWRLFARVPLPTQGTRLNGGIQIGQLCKILQTTPPTPPSGHSVAMVSRNLLYPTGPFAGRNIRRYAPQFVVIPNE